MLGLGPATARVAARVGEPMMLPATDIRDEQDRLERIAELAQALINDMPGVYLSPEIEQTLDELRRRLDEHWGHSYD